MQHDEEFTAFAAARWGDFVRAGVVLGCRLEDAQDLAQTTLLRCHTAWSRVQRAEDRDAYVYRILLNCHRDSRRRRWSGEQPSDDVPEQAHPDGTAEIDASDAVRRALGDLPTPQREVVVLRHLAGLSEARTAEVLGIAPGTVKSRLSRALAALATNPHLQGDPR